MTSKKEKAEARQKRLDVMEILLDRVWAAIDQLNT
jgi:hypothetical protein